MRQMRATFAGAAMAVGILFLVSAAGPAAAAIIFDFEDPVGGVGGHFGSIDSLTMAKSGLTVVITRSSGERFDVVNQGDIDAFPTNWGSQALSPFFNELIGDAFIANFSQPVSSVSVETGDFGADSEDRINLVGFSLPNLQGPVDSDLVIWTGDFGGSGPGDPAIGLSVSSELGILSVAFFGGSPNEFPHSVFFDNLTVTVIPEPSTALLLGLGLTGLAAAGRRRAH